MQGFLKQMIQISLQLQVGCSCWLLIQEAGRRHVLPLFLSGIRSLRSRSLFSSVTLIVFPVSSKVAAEYGGGTESVGTAGDSCLKAIALPPLAPPFCCFVNKSTSLLSTSGVIVC